MIIGIKNATYLADYKILFLFSDDTEKTIDFEHFLADAKNPMTRKYLDRKLFQSFSLIYGDISWNDYELCFPVWDLYQGNL